MTISNPFSDDPRPSEILPPEVAPPEVVPSEILSPEILPPEVAPSEILPSEPASTASPPMSVDSPQFGLVDVIEAFTAMRHEWRGHTRENRELAESMQTMAANLCQLETRLLDRVGEATDEVTSDDRVAGDLIRVIIEIDIHLTRALDATRNYEASQLRQREDDLTAIRASFDRRNFVARWFSRPLWQATERILEKGTRADQPSSPTIEGLTLLVARLHRMMQDQQIQRFDTVGLPFDAEQMNAIASVESESQASGHVVEQLAPGYFWRGQLVRYAEVRVAQ